MASPDLKKEIPSKADLIPALNPELKFNLSSLIAGDQTTLDRLKEAKDKRELTRPHQDRFEEIQDRITKLSDKIEKSSLNAINFLTQTGREDAKKLYIQILDTFGIGEKTAEKLFTLLSSTEKTKRDKGQELLAELFKKNDTNIINLGETLKLLIKSGDFGYKDVSAFASFVKELDAIFDDLGKLGGEFDVLRRHFDSFLKPYRNNLENPLFAMKRSGVDLDLFAPRDKEESQHNLYKLFQDSRLTEAQKLISEISQLERDILALSPAAFSIERNESWPVRRLKQLEDKLDVKQVQLRYYLSMHSYENPN
jgi:hypothetical protein